jgi:hypothetical protein
MEGVLQIAVPAVGAADDRPAFGTNAICRRQIQPGPVNVPGWIALSGDCSPLANRAADDCAYGP